VGLKLVDIWYNIGLYLAMSTAEKSITIAIDTTNIRVQGVRWPHKWKVRRGDSKEILSEGPRPNFVVMPFKDPPTVAQIRQVAHNFDPLLRDYLTSVIVFCCKCNMRAFDTAKLQHWLTEFPFPERVTFTTNWADVFGRVRETIARDALRGKAEQIAPPRLSALDQIPGVIEASNDLRDSSSGRLSAETIAGVFGMSKTELAGLFDRSPQALWKTPDAESLQDGLAYFERIGRLRLLLKDSGDFKKWLRTANPRLGNRTPLELIKEKRWQIVADLVDDILVGSPG
jgi:antitoxin Xre/MbcA/ParS-like protein